MGLQRVGHGSVTFTFTASGGSRGSIPGLGRAHLIQRNKAHASQLLNPRAAAIEAWEPGASIPQQEKPEQWESCALQPCSPQLMSSNEGPAQPENKIK